MTQSPESTDERWFAMRVFNNRILRIREELDRLGARTYLSGKVPSLLFARWTPDALKDFKQRHFTDLMLYKKSDSPDPAPIDDREMQMFILVTSALDGQEVEFAGEHFDFKPGERVRVTEGPFKGAEGVIRRIKKDRKLLIAVSGIVVVAVSHIPGQFLEKIEIS